VDFLKKIRIHCKPNREGSTASAYGYQIGRPSIRIFKCFAALAAFAAFAATFLVQAPRRLTRCVSLPTVLRRPSSPALLRKLCI